MGFESLKSSEREHPLLSLFPIGAHVVAYGPRLPEKPDIEGLVVGVRKETGLVLVQEKVYETPTPVNPWGGWVTLTVDGREVKKRNQKQSSSCSIEENAYEF